MMLKEIFHDKSEKNRNYKDFYGKPYNREWMAKVVFLIQMFPLDIRLKILRSLNFNMLFQLVLTKVNCFHVYRKLIT